MGSSLKSILSLLFNIVLPSLILTKSGLGEHVGFVWELLVALAFPLFYGFWEMVQSRTFSWIALIGVFGVLFTGGVGLLRLNKDLIAYKEAFVPFVMGVGLAGMVMFAREKVFDFLGKIIAFDVLKKKGKLSDDTLHKEVAILMSLVIASFFMSSFLNFMLAKIILKSDPGTTLFNEEIGKMTALSFPVIVVPSMALFMVGIFLFLYRIKKKTSLDFEQILKIPDPLPESVK